MMMHRFLQDDLAKMLNIKALETAPSDWPVLNYRPLDERETSNQFLHIEEVLNDPNLRICSPDSQKVWEQGWGEVLQRVQSASFDETQLNPQYFKHQIFRLNGQFVYADTPAFEEKIYKQIKRYLFMTYFNDIKQAIEFGCGTGQSLLLLAQCQPNIKITGCDWSGPAVEIAKTIAKETHHDISGQQVNLFNLEGSDTLNLDSDTAIYTFHTLEQLGKEHRDFVNWLLYKQPKRCIHLEPIKEFYNPELNFDQVAIRYHERRNYLDGFYNYLKQLENEGKLIIRKAHRLGFGSQYQEAYSLVIWEPITQ